MSRRRADWFMDLFGFEEYPGRNREALERTRADLAYDYDRGILKSKHQERSYVAGRFVTPSVEELRKAANLEEAKAKLPGKLTWTEVVDDVSKLHTETSNLHATFQAASQFNCLEFVSQSIVPEFGITGYAADHTQGPACAIACGPGTAVRNYFGLPKDGVGRLLPQTREEQVENLKEVEDLLDNRTQKYFEVQGGYTMASEDGLRRLAERLRQSKEDSEGVRSKLRIGVQEDTEVTSSCFGTVPFEAVPGTVQLVTQAYCSACSVAYTRASDEVWEPLARLVLEAAYEATMYVAVENALRHDGREGSKKVYLTMLGGGVFGNCEEWIVDAMQRAFGIFEGVGLEVYVVSFGRPCLALEPLLSKSPGAPATGCSNC